MSKTMLNSSGESEHPCLVPDFRGNAFNISPLRKDSVHCGFIIYGFYYVEVCSLYAWFLKVVVVVGIINECWSLSKAFYASIEIIIWFIYLNLLMWYIILIDLQILKNYCIPGIKPTWSWCMTFSICCWILFARILFRIFASMFISDIGLQFCVCVCVCVCVSWLFMFLLSVFQIWSEKVLSRRLQGGFPRSF